MSDFRVTTLSSPENGLWRLYKGRERIQIDPSYQRPGDIWTKSKKQMLIDTILNGFDVPKVYLHRFPGGKDFNGNSYDYAIIDGKQRLGTIFDFIDGKFSLSDDFEYFQDSTVSAGGMNYAALAANYPDLKTDFDSFTLSVVAIEASDDEIIEDLFSRLNEAVPLSAAEKRNAFAGPAPKAIRSLTEDIFFTKKLPFSNNRYRHFNLAAMFLLNGSHTNVMDTKKTYLDDFVRSWKGRSDQDFDLIVDKVRAITSVMERVFDDGDDLLKQIGMVIVYFHAFKIAVREGWDDRIQRQLLVGFDKERMHNRLLAEEDITKADYDLLEFDRYAQSPNDAYAVKFRLSTFLNKGLNVQKNVEEL